MRKTIPIALALAAAAGIIWSGLASSTVAPKSDVTAITHVRLFDGERVTENATVVFRKGTITGVGTDVEVPAGAEVIDGKGRTLLPGLIDAHTHNYDASLERALVFGVTTQVDMFTSLDFLRVAKREQQEGRANKRADLISAGTLVTVKGGHGTEYFPIPTFSPGGDAQAFIDARIDEGSDFIKLVYDDGAAFHMHLETLTPSDLASLITAAHKRHKLAVVHISSLEGARVALTAGADGLVHLFGDHKIDDDLVALTARKKAFVIPTLTVIESTGGGASGASLADDKRLTSYLLRDEQTSLRASFGQKFGAHEALRHASAAVARLNAAHVPLLAGTDAPNPGTAHGASMHRELELLVAAGLTPLEALRAATATNADTFGLSDRGRIVKGKRADLLLVDGDPTVTVTDTRAITEVWKAGVRFDRPLATADGAAAAPSPEILARGTISNFDDGTLDTAFGSGWSISTDSLAGGKSTATVDVAKAGAGGSARSMHVLTETRSGALYPWAGVMFSPGVHPMAPVDLSSKAGIRFLARGTGPLRVMIFSVGSGRVPRMTTMMLTSEWKEETLLWKDLDLDGSDIKAFIFCGPADGRGEFWLDSLTLR